MKHAVVICTRNRPDDLAACLASIGEQARRPAEVVIVDASDGDGSRRVVEAWTAATSAACVKHLRAAPGLTRQRNLGVAATAGDLVTFLDDDVVLAPGYLLAIAELFEVDGGLGGAEGTVRAEPLSGRRRLANVLARLFLMNSVGRRRVKPSGFVAVDPWPASVRLVDCLAGCNMTYRRDVFARFRFDEWYDGYGLGEDEDFSYRVSRVWRLVQSPHARLVHRVSPVARERVAALHEMTTVNHYYFVRKNLPSTARTWLAFGWSELGLALSVLKTRDREAITAKLRAYRRIAHGLAARAAARTQEVAV